MANLTTGRVNHRGRVRGDVMAFYPHWSSSVATNYYRGGAVIHTLAGATPATGAGGLDRTLDGTVYGIFAGVVEHDVTIPALAAAIDTFAEFDLPAYGVAVQRTGTVRFNAVAGYTPSVADVGKTAWFHTDNEVGLSPATGATALYPVCAGVIVGISGTTVEVDITHAVGVRPETFNLSFNTGALVAAINANAVELLLKAAAATAGRFVFNKRVYINQVFASVITAIDVADVNVQHSKSNAAYATVATVPVSGIAIGQTFGGVVQAVYDPTDVLGLAVQSAGNPTAGELMITLECYNL